MTTEQPSSQVIRLHAMLEVELASARHVVETSALTNSYVHGRAGAYDFVLTAMELYWPDLQRHPEITAEMFRPIPPVHPNE